MIETRYLRYFLAVAREQSITRAAETLHISQPTLSKQMMELEEHLGRRLFIRSKKRIELTDDGVFLRARAQEMLELMDKTEAAFLCGEELISGDIYLGCGETPAMGDIVKTFKKVQEEHPEIRLHIYSGDAEAVLERLDKGLLDIGLLLGPREMDKYDYMHMKQRDRFGLLMPKDCELAKDEYVDIKKLMGIPIIMSQQVSNGNHKLDWGGIRPEKLNVVATYNLIYNATFLVEQGIGYAMCLENLVPDDGVRDLTFRPIKPDIYIGMNVVTKKYQTFSPAAKAFIMRFRQENMEGEL